LSGESSAPAGEATPVLEETRGPFEPLTSSGAPPAPPVPDTAGPVTPTTPGTGGKHAAPHAAGHDGQPDPAHAQARKLDQIKDFYLTAEAIGERNVDKHFDQLIAQQRELISEYFKQSNAATPPDDRTEPPPSANVIAEQPRA
jgi:hypothetical protein